MRQLLQAGGFDQGLGFVAGQSEVLQPIGDLERVRLPVIGLTQLIGQCLTCFLGQRDRQDGIVQTILLVGLSPQDMIEAQVGQQP